MPGFGRLAAPDPRDTDFPIRAMLGAPSARQYRYWSDHGWWGDQGATSQCVAYAWCMSPDHRVLTADLRWVRLGDLRVGDRLLGFDEQPEPDRYGRYFQEALVEGIRIEPRPVLDIELSTGQVLTSTVDHQWLVERHLQWRRTGELRAGRQMASHLPRLWSPWTDATDYESGWLAGLLDGEGTIGRYGHVSFGQNPGVVLDRATALLTKMGRTFHVSSNGRPSGFNQNATQRRVQLNGGRHESVPFLGSIRPTRLLENFEPKRLGRMECRPGSGHAVVRKGNIYQGEVAVVQTSTRTMIVEGYPVHNCHWLEDGPVTHPGPVPMLNPAALYADAQRVDEWDGEGYDGTSVRAGAKVLQSRGLISSYYWATTIEEIVQAVLEEGPVVVGTNWYAAMMAPVDGRLVPSGDVVGGHAWVLNGVNRRSGLFRAKNSWSRGWSLAGRAWISIGHMARLLREDGEACLAVEAHAA